MGDTQYESFEAAYAAAADGQTVKLLSTIGENAPISLNMTHDLYIDLDGWYLYADVTANGYSIYGKDSVTDSFDSEDYGAVVVTGATVNTQQGYLAYNWDNGIWSFHHYEVKLIAVSLKPNQDALGYKAQFFGDDVVCDMVTGFGFTMSTDSKTVTAQSDKALTNGQIFTLRLQNVMASGGGETAITASAFVNFGTQTETTAHHTTSMKDTVLAINDIWNSLNADQKAAVKDLYNQYSAVMTPWFEGRTNNLEA